MHSRISHSRSLISTAKGYRILFLTKFNDFIYENVP